MSKPVKVVAVFVVIVVVFVKKKLGPKTLERDIIKRLILGM